MNLTPFTTANLFDSATGLFQQLGIKLNSNTKESLPVRDILKQHFKDTEIFRAIDKTFFIGIIDDSIFKVTGIFDVSYSYKDALLQGEKSYEGLMLFALELTKQPTRTEISELTRAFNRISQKMPVALLLKYRLKVENELAISLTISERFKYKQNWRQGEKAGKVIILRDIHTLTPHAGHLRILKDLVKPVGVTNYTLLHEHWLQVLDVSLLNKKFFQELANWYFWAMSNVQFPDDIEKKKDIRNATNLIRLITRIIFIWFIKEKRLVPASLFRRDFLDKTVKDFIKNKKSENYYQAILQNLFFGTLNQKMNERGFVKDGNYQQNMAEYGVKNLFRYADKFNITEKEVVQLFKEVPFLNGGLFDCLDKPNEENKIAYVDGFSRNEKKQAHVPDYLFFGDEIEVDLNETYGTENKIYKVGGLINLLESYKFTVAENTPIEEEIALDPELLGKVFENLLASYNPETQTTARKQTGSFYTPREIVNYMVEESLLQYLKETCVEKLPESDSRLRELFSYSENPNAFNENETKILIEAINNCKILDPACGSGAYPMGVLHKMVHILQKLDKDNVHWKELQRTKAIEETETAYKNDDKDEREKRLIEINDVFENNASDYGRKLYLIENCIYGIDIQPIAVQIAKLRFFISLIIDQNKQEGKENFGIRSLPNLETKFVAANSLVGLSRPKQKLLRNIQIEEKEKELGDLRHNYFTAKSRREKIQYQAKDKKLRKDIAKLLENDGWDISVARQIVAFDPYDQNLSAPFFESEWMFGLTTGFDIVIGNPPYIDSETMVNIGLEGLRNYLVSRLKYTRGNWDIYIAFFEVGFNLLNSNGIITYITPDKWISKPFGYELRKNLLDNYFVITESGRDVFESANVDSIITFITKTKNSVLRVNRFLDSEVIRIADVPKKSIIEPFAFDWLFSEQIKIINSLDKFDSVLSDLGLCDSACATSDAYKLKEYIVNISSSSFSADKYLKIINTGTIDKYISKWGSSEMTYLGDKYLFPAAKKREFTNAFTNSYGLKSLKKKLIIKGLTLLDVCYDMKGEIIPGKSTLIVTSKNERNLKFILGLLNSKLPLFYIKEKYRGSSYNQGINFNKGMINSLPIPKLNDRQIDSVVDIVDKILAKKQSNPTADITNYQIQLNELVYRFYELTNEDIAIIENK